MVEKYKRVDLLFVCRYSLHCIFAERTQWRISSCMHEIIVSSIEDMIFAIVLEHLRRPKSVLDMTGFPFFEDIITGDVA